MHQAIYPDVLDDLHFGLCEFVRRAMDLYGRSTPTALMLVEDAFSAGAIAAFCC
jgi:hypothetical protein